MQQTHFLATRCFGVVGRKSKLDKSLIHCVALQGVSDIPCSNTSPVEYCIDQIVIDPYLSQAAKFHPATADQPYNFTIEIKLDGGITGTATLQSLGVHLS